jgi:hypothetical protein
LKIFRWVPTHFKVGEKVCEKFIRKKITIIILIGIHYKSLPLSYDDINMHYMCSSVPATHVYCGGYNDFVKEQEGVTKISEDFPGGSQLFSKMVKRCVKNL